MARPASAQSSLAASRPVSRAEPRTRPVCCTARAPAREQHEPPACRGEGGDAEGAAETMDVGGAIESSPASESVTVRMWMTTAAVSRATPHRPLAAAAYSALGPRSRLSLDSDDRLRRRARSSKGGINIGHSRAIGLQDFISELQASTDGGIDQCGRAHPEITRRRSSRFTCGRREQGPFPLLEKGPC